MYTESILKIAYLLTYVRNKVMPSKNQKTIKMSLSRQYIVIAYLLLKVFLTSSHRQVVPYEKLVEKKEQTFTNTLTHVL